MGGSQRARRVRTRSRSGGRGITSVKEAIERAGDGSSGPRSVVCALLSAYGKPTIDFSVASVVLVSCLTLRRGYRCRSPRLGRLARRCHSPRRGCRYHRHLSPYPPRRRRAVLRRHLPCHRWCRCLPCPLWRRCLPCRRWCRRPTCLRECRCRWFRSIVQALKVTV